MTLLADPNNRRKPPDFSPTAMYMIEGLNDGGLVKAVYVGITNDLDRRMEKHREREGIIWQMLTRRCLDQVSVGGLWFPSRVHAALAERVNYRQVLKAERYRTAAVLNKQVPYDKALRHVAIVDGYDWETLTLGTEEIDFDIDFNHFSYWYYP